MIILGWTLVTIQAILLGCQAYLVIKSVRAKSPYEKEKYGNVQMLVMAAIVLINLAVILISRR